MKRAIIRALWGSFYGFDSDITTPKPSKLLNEIKSQSECELCKTEVYVFGTWNCNFLKSLKYNPVQISEKNSIWDMKTELYRHKLEVLKCAMTDYDEIVYLDWDCIPQKTITDDIWGILGKKESLQANLQLYKSKKCLWRKVDQRKTCNGGFIYIRDKNIPDLLIKNWDGFKKFTDEQANKRRERNLELREREKSLIYNDEPSLSMYVDSAMGQWNGSEDYWNHYEPEICNLKTKSAYDKDRLSNKNVFFEHEL